MKCDDGMAVWSNMFCNNNSYTVCSMKYSMKYGVQYVA